MTSCRAGLTVRPTILFGCCRPVLRTAPGHGPAFPCRSPIFAGTSPVRDAPPPGPVVRSERLSFPPPQPARTPLSLQPEARVPAPRLRPLPECDVFRQVELLAQYRRKLNDHR